MVWVVLVLEAFLDFGVAAINDDLVAGRICRGEEGETHDVIPMGMAYQKVNNTLALTARTLHEFNSKLSDAGASIEYDFGILANNFHTGSVATGGGALVVGKRFDIPIHRPRIVQVDTAGATQGRYYLVFDLSWRDGRR